MSSNIVEGETASETGAAGVYKSMVRQIIALADMLAHTHRIFTDTHLALTLDYRSLRSDRNSKCHCCKKKVRKIVSVRVVRKCNPLANRAKRAKKREVKAERRILREGLCVKVAKRVRCECL
jgi:hypothetical protein